MKSKWEGKENRVFMVSQLSWGGSEWVQKLALAGQKYVWMGFWIWSRNITSGPPNETKNRNNIILAFHNGRPSSVWNAVATLHNAHFNGLTCPDFFWLAMCVWKGSTSFVRWLANTLQTLWGAHYYESPVLDIRLQMEIPESKSPWKSSKLWREHVPTSWNG
jgi:hypothetical protein